MPSSISSACSVWVLPKQKPASLTASTIKLHFILSLKFLLDRDLIDRRFTSFVKMLKLGQKEDNVGL